MLAWRALKWAVPTAWKLRCLRSMGAFWLRTQVCFVTWCRSRVRTPGEFERKLLARLPAGTKVFGCMEWHQDGTPHFHAAVCFARSKYIENAREAFCLYDDRGQVDTWSIHFQLPLRKQEVGEFLEKVQRYCAKNFNDALFGAWIEPPEEGVRRDATCMRCGDAAGKGAGIVCQCCSAEHRGAEATVSGSSCFFVRAVSSNDVLVA